MRIINWIKENKIGTAVIVGVIIELVYTAIISIVNKINWWNAFLMAWKNIFTFLKDILICKIPVWVILIAVLIIIIVKFVIIRILNEKENIDNRNHKYREYVEDTYDGRRYEWDYIEDGNTLSIDNIKIICPTCKGNIIKKNEIGNIYYGGIEKLFCPNCQKIVCDAPSSNEVNEARVYIGNKINQILKEN